MRVQHKTSRCSRPCNKPHSRSLERGAPHSCQCQPSSISSVFGSGRSLKLCRGFFRLEINLQTMGNVVFRTTPSHHHTHIHQETTKLTHITQDGPPINTTDISAYHHECHYKCVHTVVTTTEDALTSAMTEPPLTTKCTWS